MEGEGCGEMWGDGIPVPSGAEERAGEEEGLVLVAVLVVVAVPRLRGRPVVGREGGGREGGEGWWEQQRPRRRWVGRRPRRRWLGASWPLRANGRATHLRLLMDAANTRHVDKDTCT